MKAEGLSVVTMVENETNAIATLTASDLAMFTRLGIPQDLLRQAQIERVTDLKARERLCIRSHGDMSGIIFPYLDPESGRRVTARLRRDNPEVEGGKQKNKYISASGDRRHLYFVLGCNG